MTTLTTRAAVVVTLIGLVLIGAGISTAQALSAPHVKLVICHRTASADGGNQHNGYNLENVNINSVASADDVNGHDSHDQDGNGPRGDIIPSFTYQGATYEGKNLDAGGLALLANFCNLPGVVVPIKPDITDHDSTSDVKDCATRQVTTTTVTTTVDWIFRDGQWVEDRSTTTTTSTRDATEIECPLVPGKPLPEIVVTSSDAVDCVAKKVTTTTVTRTTGWKLENNKWVTDSTVTTQDVTTRDATPQECTRVLVKPSPEIVVTSSDAVDCVAEKVTTTTVTKTTGWKLENNKWVTDSTVTTQNVITRDATQAECPVEVLGVGGVAPAVTSPAVGSPAVASPAVASPAVASAANPLPAAAAAGDAETSGQLAAGSLTGLAALMTLGAGFLLRRRDGEV